ncbi:protein of unknown function [Paraburkholderia kururiensis]
MQHSRNLRLSQFYSRFNPNVSTQPRKESTHVSHQHASQTVQGHGIPQRRIRAGFGREPQGQVVGRRVLPG